MLTRRSFLAAGAAAPLLPRLAEASGDLSQPQLNEDGLYEQPFFIQSFLVLAEDLEQAADAGKRFAVMWELKGCPYCKETHFVNFARPDIADFVASHFDILQLNLVGSREVTDFDGEAMSEKELARKWGVRFTPTISFYPPSLDEVAGRSGKAAEVARMPGYFKPPHFLAMFRYVEEEAYKDERFDSYLRRSLRG